jgi:hypothetical protein
LIAIGTPANARGSSRVTVPAASSARSASTSTKALRSGPTRSMRRMQASTASTGLSSPPRMRAATSVADA